MTQQNINARELDQLVAKAHTLMEALPHIQRFRDATIVIKYGGHAMIDPDLKQMVARDLVLAEHVGINPVVVHGGGPEISDLMDRVGLKPEFIDGQRITDAEALEITEMVLAGKLNGEIVTRIHQIGGRAVGISGKDGALIEARKFQTTSGQDMGYVGEVVAIHPNVIRILDQANFIPVISPIGASPDGQTYNINADAVAARLAGALKATKLILMTDVRGIYRDPQEPETLISEIHIDQVDQLIRDGVIRGGMIPKVHACQQALAAGVQQTHILDGRLPHALLIELFTDHGIGTMIRP